MSRTMPSAFITKPSPSKLVSKSFPWPILRTSSRLASLFTFEDHLAPSSPPPLILSNCVRSVFQQTLEVARRAAPLQAKC